jgi:hypothetical protein
MKLYYFIHTHLEITDPWIDAYAGTNYRDALILALDNYDNDPCLTLELLRVTDGLVAPKGWDIIEA